MWCPSIKMIKYHWIHWTFLNTEQNLKHNHSFNSLIQIILLLYNNLSLLNRYWGQRKYLELLLKWTAIRFYFRGLFRPSLKYMSFLFWVTFVILIKPEIIPLPARNTSNKYQLLSLQHNWWDLLLAKTCGRFIVSNINFNLGMASDIQCIRDNHA